MQNLLLQIDLSCSTAAILGQGNVALDVARILLKPIDELSKTDITEHALNTLAESKIEELYLIGRRGPLQVAFTIKELREQLKLNNCRTEWRQSDFQNIIDIVSELPRPRKRLTELMLKSLTEMNNPNDIVNKKCFRPLFFRSPQQFFVDDNKKLIGMDLSCNRLVGDKWYEQQCIPTDEKETINCGLALRSIGYKSIKVDKDLEFNNGVVVNDKGFVKDKNSKGIGKLYVAGWLGTGPVGVILHTMGNAFQVAKLIGEDLNKNKDHHKFSSTTGFTAIKNLIEKNTSIVHWDGWQKIDKYEIEQGKLRGKPREKICSVNKMIEIANS